MYTDGVCDSSLEQGNQPIKKEIAVCNKLLVHSAEYIIKSIINKKEGQKGARMNDDDASLLLLRISS
jgi:serine phosphatase RsbU (regulator of sigma subunit)